MSGCSTKSTLCIFPAEHAHTSKTVADMPGVSWIARASWAASFGLVASMSISQITRNSTRHPFWAAVVGHPAVRAYLYGYDTQPVTLPGLSVSADFNELEQLLRVLSGYRSQWCCANSIELSWRYDCQPIVYGLGDESRERLLHLRTALA
jgi:hypothetical protein